MSDSPSTPTKLNVIPSFTQLSSTDNMNINLTKSLENNKEKLLHKSSTTIVKQKYGIINGKKVSVFSNNYNTSTVDNGDSSNMKNKNEITNSIGDIKSNSDNKIIKNNSFMNPSINSNNKNNSFMNPSINTNNKNNSFTNNSSDSDIMNPSINSDSNNIGINNTRENIIIGNSNTSDNIWVEKYRPVEINQVVYVNDFTRKIFEKIVKTKSLPHLLLSGPPGVGKTSTIVSLAKELFKDVYNDRVTLINASEERGIGCVREKINEIAFQYVYMDSEIPPYKLIILDEADAMTREAQCALRRLIEISSEKTRFCFICNYKNKIIYPIESRCMHIEFPPLNNDQGLLRLQHIAKMENILIEKHHLQIILDKSKGDMRKAITLLQNISHPMRTKNKKNEVKIKSSTINMVCDVVESNVIKLIINNCNSDKMRCSEFDPVARYLVVNSYSLSNVIYELIDTIIISDKYNDNMKADSLILLNDSFTSTMMGCNQYICYMNLLVKLNKIFTEKDVNEAVI
jgi:replication factor C subunit 2/4